jgi:magnesium and cobalt transporter
VVDALTPIEDFNEQFRADFPDDEYDTIGGLITAAIGHLPEAGEELSMDRFHFRVGRADARRVHSFVVSVHAPD